MKPRVGKRKLREWITMLTDARRELVKTEPDEWVAAILGVVIEDMQTAMLEKPKS